jgi:hypothetical protein
MTDCGQDFMPGLQALSLQGTRHSAEKPGCAWRCHVRYHHPGAVRCHGQYDHGAGRDTPPDSGEKFLKHSPPQMRRGGALDARVVERGGGCARGGSSAACQSP